MRKTGKPENRKTGNEENEGNVGKGVQVGNGRQAGKGVQVGKWEAPIQFEHEDATIKEKMKIKGQSNNT